MENINLEFKYWPTGSKQVAKDISNPFESPQESSSETSSSLVQLPFFNRMKLSRMWSTNKRDSSKGHASSSSMTDAELDKEFQKLVDGLRLPASAAANMLKLPKSQKIEMIKAQKVKATTQKKESGKVWAKKFSNNQTVPVTVLQELVVVLKDSEPKFVQDFISELGLQSLCRIGKDKLNVPYDTQLLLIFKGMIDTEGNVISLINNNSAIKIMAQKIESPDARVRELALQLLISLVAVDSELLDKAVDDIMNGM